MCWSEHWIKSQTALGSKPTLPTYHVTLDMSLSCLSISVLLYKREIIISVVKVVLRTKNDNI